MPYLNNLLKELRSFRNLLVNNFRVWRINWKKPRKNSARLVIVFLGTYFMLVQNDIHLFNLCIQLVELFGDSPNKMEVEEFFKNFKDFRHEFEVRRVC